MVGDEHRDDDDEVLRETLAALEMPPAGLRKWFDRSARFCNAHGGARRYGALLALYADCLARLDSRE